MSFKSHISLPLTLSLTLVPSLGSASTESFVPHRAIYDIRFDQAQTRSPVVGGSGKWVLEVNGSSCTGFDVSYRFVTKLANVSGGEVLIDTRGKNFESGEGEAFDFSNSTYQDNKLVDEVKGVASRRDNETTVKLAKPSATDLKLGSDVLFPVQHFSRLVEKAKQGEKVVSSTVFEGVEGGRDAYDVTAVISAEGRAVPSADKPYSALEEKELRRWPVSLSYYKAGERQDSTPEWQNSFLLYENGVSREFTFDYGDFSMKGTLQSLEFLPEEDCS